MRINLKWPLITCSLLAMASCNEKDSGKAFSIRGTIENTQARKIYLDEVASTQSTVVDSAEIKDGKFSLGAGAHESVIYNLRLDDNVYPVAYVINDKPKVEIDVVMNPDNPQFSRSYDVKGSPASQAMREYIQAFTRDLQELYYLRRGMDSLKRSGGGDSSIQQMKEKGRMIAEGIREFTINSIRNASDPALLIFQLGYYQATSNNPMFGLEPIPLEQEDELVKKATEKFPNHKGLAEVRKSAEERMATRLLGNPAPDFTLPDVNGKEVSLSSLRGKYVLVDFWASWCQPCRVENPNVVEAFNRFRDKNFTVLGVSLDKPGEKDKWLEAIRKDKLNWQHVSDLKYWESIVVPLYRIQGIPFNVLVDPDGKVIAEGLRGEALHLKLEQLLK